jgi:AP2 domain
MPRRNPRRNLTRVEVRQANGASCRGWEVRIQRQGILHCRFFSDRQFGGNRGALNEAKAFRDTLEKQLRPLTVRVMAETPSSRNSSGVVGVRRSRQTYTADGGDYLHEFWVAQWIDGHGQRKTRSFSIAKYGEEHAWQLALEARKQGVNKAKRVVRR